MPRETPFVVKNVKYLLLTYAQVGEDFDFEAIVELATTLGAECIIGREQHADGGTHYHAFLEFGSFFSTRSSRRFDLGGKHPNIAQVGRTPWVAYDYAIKDGDVVAGGAERPRDGRLSSGGPGGNADDWRYILDAECRDDYFVRLRERAPRSLACNFPSLCKYADWRWRRTVNQYAHPPGLDFALTDLPDLSEWVDDNTRGGIDR